MKKIYIGLIMAILLPVLTGCNKWLDISPEDEISAEEMFKKTEGFYNVLNGIYLELGKPSLYGSTLSWKEMEAWGMGYNLDKDLSSHESMYALSRRDYEHERAMSAGETIWSNAYKNIARLNMFMQYANEKTDDFFNHGVVEKHLLLGEALALRAYLHFDLLRIFAKNYRDEGGPDGVHIPFVEKYPSIVNPPVKSSVVMERIIADLVTAANYVAEYDLHEDNRGNVISYTSRFSKSASADWGKFYSMRGCRMNYFAIRILQARVALYAGDYENAMKYAQEIIDLEKDKSISFISAYSLANEPKMMQETFFAFHYDKLIEATQDWFDRIKNHVLSLEDIVNFKADKNDKRVTMQENGILTLFNEDKNGAETLFVPALRFGEVYYIMAESYLKTGNTPEAVKTLNVLLKARKASLLSEDTAADKVLEFMVNDARKEFAGLGQNVFMYKRLGEPVHFSGGKDNASVGNLVLPIPHSESVTL